MSLIQMSVSGGILILAVIVLRALALNRLPKWTFLALWGVAALRLLVPFSVPSPASIYTLAESVPPAAAAPAAELPEFTFSAAPFLPGAAPVTEAGGAAETHPAAVPETSLPVWRLVWLAGAAVCGTFFLLSYLRCRREFQTALPVEDRRMQAWLARQRLRRKISLRQSDRVDAPLTYGLLRPIILFPKNWAGEGGGCRCAASGPAAVPGSLTAVLEHELAHIRHLDALWKLILVLAACVHWFNPLVWCMFVLANWDIELRCDETVVRRLGLDSRSAYALTLISMEEKKSGLSPLTSPFSKNAIEERIVAIMKIKKRSLAATLAAVVLVCCIGAGFATSAAAKTQTPYPEALDGFTRQELDRIASLWFEGWADMTVTEYQQKMWIEFDTPEDMALIERYAQSAAQGICWDEAGTTSFHDYFYQVYEPLTAHNWQERTFSDEASVKTEDGGTAVLEYDITMHILDPNVLTAGEYQRRLHYTKASMERMLALNMTEEQSTSIYQMLSSATPDGILEITIMSRSPYTREAGQSAAGPDADFHAQISHENAAEWDRLLTPYMPFGLTWEFNDPDLDGNGLTMWFQGKEVRSITDEQEGIWIAEHVGNGFSDGAVELYAVYTDGKLSGLRLATAGEQAGWDAIHNRNSVLADTISEESREFPQATLEDYDALLTLRLRDTENETLESFNQHLLDWANENTDAWNRINCDVIWNDFNQELTTDARTFASITCYFSGAENGQMVRALYTGGPEQDPGWARNLPMKYNKKDGIVNAWCGLYYDISYHISDKSSATVQERDACVGGMMNAVSAFWQETDLDTLLTMTEDDVVRQFNAWAEEASTENVKINSVTADDIHFEPYDERGINYN